MNNKEKNQTKEFEYPLSFTEALDVLFAEKNSGNKGFIVGQNFEPGVFLDVDSRTETIIIMKFSKNGYINLGYLTLEKGLLRQQYRKIIVASKQQLGLD